MTYSYAATSAYEEIKKIDATTSVLVIEAPPTLDFRPYSDSSYEKETNTLPLDNEVLVEHLEVLSPRRGSSSVGYTVTTNHGGGACISSIKERRRPTLKERL